MNLLRRLTQWICISVAGFSVAWACGFDNTLREYLDAHFWLPFSKGARHAARARGGELSAPFAGMEKVSGTSPLAQLRAAYQGITDSLGRGSGSDKLPRVLAAARAVPTLTPREREEVELIDAKIDMRFGDTSSPEPWRRAEKKLLAFLQNARTPEFLSEARGWLAHIHYQLGDRTRAGKIYLDELNRNDSNLSQETLLTSLRMVYGYDGGPQLLAHLDEYFDTPEHAAFAIQLATNPRWSRRNYRDSFEEEPVVTASPPYERIKGLLERHPELWRTRGGAETLTLLSMRTALRAGDPRAALHLAARAGSAPALRRDPDFNWMKASAHYLSRDYAGAEAPLRVLFQSTAQGDARKSAAAYGLCGVFQKTGNVLEQLRFALWLRSADPELDRRYSSLGQIEDQSVYWAYSGWDLDLLLEVEAPVEVLREFLEKYPRVRDRQLVEYSLAVRLARANEYEESARLYESVNARRRAERSRKLALLYQEANRPGASLEELMEGKYKLAEYISSQPDRLYFNDRLWDRFQQYAFIAERDVRLNREERRKQMAAERTLQDEQEERWRAYRILREVVSEAGPGETGRKSAQLAIHCLRGISTRFGRRDEIEAADVELSKWLRRPRPFPAVGE